MLQWKDSVKFIKKTPQQRGNVHVERIQNPRTLKHTATATMEGTKKKRKTM
jgi:hypothetical protein